MAKPGSIRLVAGCAGCHIFFLDIDERLLVSKLVDLRATSTD